MLRDAPNIQSLWGDLIVEELIRNGVDEFIVCPGSRSTPLVQAIQNNPRAQATIWLDERGAAFHALGRARGGSWPVAVVTTSGTAVANLLPAVVEASLDGVPLILLTADRPHELREVGANQSIKQTGIFADHVRWAFDLPAPDMSMPVRALLTTVDHAVHSAVDGHEGPVQLNCPFREPLAPTVESWDAGYLEAIAGWVDGEQPLLVIEAGESFTLAADEDLAALVASAERGLIVCGRWPWFGVPEDVEALARTLGWPVWTDIRCGARLGESIPGRAVHLDRVLEAELWTPDVVIQLGSRITSKRMQRFLGSGAAKHYLLVDPEPSRLDPTHTITHRFAAGIDSWCAALGEALSDQEDRDTPSLPANAAIEAAIETAVMGGDDLSEPYVLRWLSRHMQTLHGLFLSNSMPIRDAQDYAATDAPWLSVGANRGASGIDGIVSSSAGFAQGHGYPTTLVIGDLAFLHDVNALAMLQPLEQPLTIVVLNNGGGSIFSFLPIAKHADVLTPLVNTPHDIRFDGVCSSFGIPYAHVTDRAGFEAAYRAAIASGVSNVIEVQSSLDGNKTHHERIEAAIAAALKDA